MPRPNLIRVLHDLYKTEAAQHHEIESLSAIPGLVRLRRWQTERLSRTYADLDANPQYTLACAFFKSDIYGEADFSQRDEDAERLHDLLSNFLPASMLRLLADTLHLNRFSAQLDLELLSVLEPGAEITPESYAEGYRRCNNAAERREQIELLTGVLREAAQGARSPLVGVSLRLAHLPAERAGWTDLYSFLERGFQACKPMRDVNFFVDTINRRESTILENIFSGKSDPFIVE